MDRILGSTLEGTRLSKERQHKRVNLYLTGGMIAGAALFGFGLDVESGLIAMPGIAIVFTAVVLLACRND